MLNKLMHLGVLPILIFIFSNKLAASIVEVSSFPSFPGTISTLMVPAVPVDSEVEKRHSFVFREEREELQLDSHHAEVLYYDYVNKSYDPDRLVVVMAGLGGTGGSGLARQIASNINKKLGVNTMTLLNPFSWKFAFAVSDNGITGQAKVDAVELYEVLEMQLDLYEKKYGTRPSQVALVGYSLGAVYSFFLDQHKKSVTGEGFDYLVMMNPPVDFKSIMKQMDALGDFITGKGRAYYEMVRTNASFAFQRVLEDFGKLSLLDIRNIIEDYRVTPKRARLIVADGFRSSLKGVITSAETLQRRGFVKAPITRWRRQAFYNEVRSSFNFAKFLDTYMALDYSEAGNPYSREIFFEETSFINRVEDIAANPRAFVFHNLDDFVSPQNDIEALYGELGVFKMTIFPRGGHLANWAWGLDENYDRLRNIQDTFWK